MRIDPPAPAIAEMSQPAGAVFQGIRGGEKTRRPGRRRQGLRHIGEADWKRAATRADDRPWMPETWEMPRSLYLSFN